MKKQKEKIIKRYKLPIFIRLKLTEFLNQTLLNLEKPIKLHIVTAGIYHIPFVDTLTLNFDNKERLSWFCTFSAENISVLRVSDAIEGEKFIHIYTI